jgi:hypothetical protein
MSWASISDRAEGKPSSVVFPAVFWRRHACFGETPGMEPPDIRYARSGDLAIAYQVVGEGPLDLVVCPFNPNLFYLWEIP